MNRLQKRVSIRELILRWHCSENTIFEIIEDGLLPVFAKSYYFDYANDEVSAKIQVTIDHTEKAKKIYPILLEMDKTLNKDNPLLPSPITLRIGEDYELYPEQIAIASTDNYSQCFFYLGDILKFESEFNVLNLECISSQNSPQKQPNIQRANNFNECIAQVIADFSDSNGYPPTTTGEVINRMKFNPPLGTIINFVDNEISINGSTPKPISKLERTIRRLLEQQKISKK